MDETTLKMLKVIEDNDIYVKGLSKQLTGNFTVTRVIRTNEF